MDARDPINVGPLILTKLFPVVPRPDTHGPDVAYLYIAYQRGTPLPNNVLPHLGSPS